MRCVAGHQANLYPYAGFFAKADGVDHFLIVDNTQYVKKEWHNRNRIKKTCGQTQWLSIPVETAGRRTQAINEAVIKPGAPWRKDHKKSLEFNYRKCPYYADYFPAFAELLDRSWHRLVDYNVAVIQLCFNLLGITTPCDVASDLGVTGPNNDLILAICRALEGDAYLHGKHARDYVDFEYLAGAGVTNLIQDYQSVPYDQPWGDFIPNLAILDILFNCGPDSLAIIRRGHQVSFQDTGEPVDLQEA